MEQQTLIDVPQKTTLGLAYGLGVDSSAIIVGYVQKGIRPDFILFADVGAVLEAARIMASDRKALADCCERRSQLIKTIRNYDKGRK